jgi:hypothetical protein
MKFLKSKPSLVAFAPIDLKDATVRLLDGFSNLTSSPTVTGVEAIGSTVIDINPGTMEITVPVGAHLTIAGDTTKYEVTARTIEATGVDEVQSAAAIASTSGNFTFGITLPGNTIVQTGNVVFSATSAAIQTLVDTALAGLVVGGITYTAGDVTVAGGPINTTPVTFTFDGASVLKQNIAAITTTDVDLNDATPPVMSTTTPGEAVGSTESVTITPALVIATTGGEAITFLPIELEIKLGEGNFTYDETREVEYIRDRGILDTYREGDEQPMDVSFDFTWEFIKAIVGSGTPTIEEALKNTGEASTWVSSNTADPCAAYVVDVEIVNAPDCGGILAEVIRLPQFFYTQLSHDSDAASVAVTGQCNATNAVITRTAVT